MVTRIDVERSNAAAIDRQKFVKADPDMRDEAVLDLKRAHPYNGYVDVKVDGAGQFVMRCNNDDPIALRYFWAGPDAWERFSLKLWVDFCKKSEGSILDIGSFSGLYSLVAASLGKTVIHAYEASRMPLMRLIENVNTNGYRNKIRVVPKAVSSESGVAEFFLKRELGTLSTGGSLVAGGDRQLSELVHRGPIDDDLSGAGVSTVSLIKVDVEGAELDVLAGMRETLSRSEAILLIELKRRLVPPAVDFLSKIGYNGYAVDEARAALLPVVDATEEVQNYIFSKTQGVFSEYLNTAK